MLDLLHQLSDWFTGFAESDWAVIVLAIGSFLESTVSPVPIDPLLIPMGVLQPNLAIFFAIVASIFSVFGALVGYWIGKRFGSPALKMFVSQSKIDKSELMFKKYGMWAILVAAVTPIPYKVFTILSGALNLPLKTFILASIVGRGIRFLSLGVFIFFFGENIQVFFESQFKNLSIAVGAGIVLVAIIVWISVKTGFARRLNRDW
jgi:membrane protein YqaA with SNARE-associated domain